MIAEGPVPFQPPRGKAKLAFLGEAPGSSEVEKKGLYTRLAPQVWPSHPWSAAFLEGGPPSRGDRALLAELPALPLVGPSGRLFDQMCRAAGIDRLDCMVTNVFEYMAPSNNVAPWLRDPDLMLHVRVRLTRELAEAGANVVVPMGGTALRLLTGRDDISKAAGSPCLATELLPGAKLLPCLHPAFILRNYKMLPLFLGALERAKREAELGPSLEFPFREFLLEPTLAEVRKWVYTMDGHLLDSRGEPFRPLLSADLLSVDIETGWGQITCIAFAPDEEHSICIPFVDLRSPNRSYWPTIEEELEVWSLVKEVLESPVPKVLQNGVYDAAWLLEKMGIRTMNYAHDTRLMHHALFPELPKDLGTLISLYSQAPQTKHWGVRKAEEKRDA